MLAHTYVQAFYTDWVYKLIPDWIFFKMFPDLYPICVECLHIGIYKHSTQTGHKKVLPDMLIKVSAFYIDWVYRFLENSVETMTPQNVPNQCRMLTKSILH